MRLTKYGITPYLFILVICFLVLDVVLIVIANKTFAGVSHLPDHDKAVDAMPAENNTSLNWKTHLVLNTQANKLTLSLNDSVGVPIVGAKIQAKLFFENQFPQSIFFKALQDGVYEASFQPKPFKIREVGIKAQVGKIEFNTVTNLILK